MRVSECVNRERAVVLGWGRAILLQLAHPLVAAGVAEHSQFSGSRGTRIKRLHGTVGAMLDLSFGDEARRRRTTDRINAIHHRVHGRLREAVGPYAAGTCYDATDPHLLRWVHATLLDSVPLAYDRFVGPLSNDEKDRYCAESQETGQLLGIPEELLLLRSADVAAFVEARLTDGTLAVGTQARWVARKLLYPPLTDPTRPAAWLTRLIAVGMLPTTIREAYGFPWSARRERGFRVASAAIRRIVRVLPPVVRYWPGSY